MEAGEGGGYLMRYFTITRRSAISWIGFLLHTLLITRVRLCSYSAPWSHILRPWDFKFTKTCTTKLQRNDYGIFLINDTVTPNCFT